MRGVTDELGMGLNTFNNFNPRAHEGRDTFSIFVSINLLDFNPRAHEGRDAAA